MRSIIRVYTMGQGDKDELEVLWNLTSHQPYDYESCGFCTTHAPVWMFQRREGGPRYLIFCVVEDDVFHISDTEILKIVKCFGCMSYRVWTPHMDKYLKVAEVYFK